MNDDDLFDFYIMDDMEKRSKPPKGNGSCLTPLLFILVVPMAMVFGIFVVI